MTKPHKITRPCPPPCTGVQTQLIYAQENKHVGWHCATCNKSFPVDAELHIWQNQIRNMERGPEDL